MRRRLVRVPGSSANLGPGFDVFAAALALHCEVEVEEADRFSVSAPGLEVPLDRSNLVVRAFEHFHPADRVRFEIRSEIPLDGGLGSSGAAIVAGLVAADHLFELGNSHSQILAAATEIEGHPDNVAASLHGGIVVCPPSGAPLDPAPADPVSVLLGPAEATAPGPLRLEPPQGVEAIAVIPDERVATAEARAALPQSVPLADATANIAAAAHLICGIERSDLALIRRGLGDRLHQPYRARLYPRSIELVERAIELGAIGATISGAGPTVLVWSFWQSSGPLVEALVHLTAGWADVQRVPFSPDGADVPEL